MALTSAPRMATSHMEAKKHGEVGRIMMVALGLQVVCAFLP